MGEVKKLTTSAGVPAAVNQKVLTAGPRARFRLFDDARKARLVSSIAEPMQGVPDFIVERRLGHFEKVDPAYAAGVPAAFAPCGSGAA